MRYFYRVLRKSKTSKFSFRRTFNFFAVSIRSRKSRQNNAFHSCPEAADVAFPWSEVIITHISLDVFFFLPKEMPSQLVVPNTLNRLNSTDFWIGKEESSFSSWTKTSLFFFVFFLLQISRMYTTVIGGGRFCCSIFIPVSHLILQTTTVRWFNHQLDNGWFLS